MDKITEKSILEEISTLVLDSQEKVTLKSISNNWSINNEQAQQVLNKWIEGNAKRSKTFTKEFLVRGTNSKGVLSFGIVPEEKKSELQKKWKNFTSWVYSIDATVNTRKLNITDLKDIKVKQILLKPTAPRDIRVPVLPPSVTEVKKTEQPKSKTPAFFKAQVKKEVPTPQTKKTPVKTEKAASIEKVKEIKVEKTPPEEKSAGNQKKTSAKNQKPAQKASISTFFNSKPTTSKSSSSTVPSTTKPKEEPKTLKREKSPELIEDSPEPPKKKKMKLKELSNNKRSRIRVIEDSSEEEEESSISEEPESKLIKFDREMTPDAEMEAQDDKNLRNDSPEHDLTDKKKRKAKRVVKKRYMTAGGFMRTEEVQEEYSVSEDEGENDENKKKNSPEVKVEKKTEKKSEKKSSEAKSTEKSTKKSGKSAKPIQTNKITSFFTKK